MMNPSNPTPTDALAYQVPPSSILNLVDVPQTPFVQVTRHGRFLLSLHRERYQSIADLSAPELRLAGLRVNPTLNIGSRTVYYNNISLQALPDCTPIAVSGLPAVPKLAHFIWSPCQTKLAFIHGTPEGAEVWYINLETGQAQRLGAAYANANLGNPICWLADGSALLVRTVPANRAALIETAKAIPTGPIITTSDGTKAQNRTYQDLLKNTYDEHNFEVLATSEIQLLNLDGSSTAWLAAADLYQSLSSSPDGNYILVKRLERPFSYLVPYQRFPYCALVYDRAGQLVQTIHQAPLAEDVPKGFMSVRIGKRQIQWRKDHPATLVWVEALDGGDAGVEVSYRDELFQLEAPFEASPQSLMKTINRFYEVEWGTATQAIVHDYWWNTRNTKVYALNPSDLNEPPRLLFDRNYQDQYGDPGTFVMKKNKWNQLVLHLEEDHLLLVGEGKSEEGQFPFIDRMNWQDATTERLYQAADKTVMETIYYPIDAAQGKFVVRLESPNDYPNYYIRTLGTESKLQQLTHFDNPFKSLQNVHKEVIRYQREDGLDLSGTLYLPTGYDKNNPKKVPLIIWAYPREYKDNNSAGQVTNSAQAFTYPYYGSMVYWVTRGYAVLDDAAFPIVGVNNEEPNDTFRTQLVANAKAAIDALDDLGYIDRKRVAVGGHSYGAFMTANLLSHCDLFAAGIARSGAYNRSLTPFGFQSEERNYWEAPEVYQNMSPFMHADKMKTPLLLVHGEADNNSGTYPLQSERYFNALKGLGATARLVMLPKESHGYVAKESILHLLWEQDTWLERYLKD